MDLNGMEIHPGQVAKVQIESGEWKTGAVCQLHEGLVTIRCNITDDNPDGQLFSAAPEKTEVLIL